MITTNLPRALLGITPHSLTTQGSQNCPDINYYQADQIVNKSDTQRLPLLPRKPFSALS